MAEEMKRAKTSQKKGKEKCKSSEESSSKDLALIIGKRLKIVRNYVYVNMLVVILVVVGLLLYKLLLSNRSESLEKTESKEIEELFYKTYDIGNQVDIESSNDEITYETDEAFLDKLFPTDGFLYKPKRDDVFFYLDVKCTKRLKNVKLSSICSGTYATVTVYYDNELTYAYRMSNKKICYSKQNISINDCIKCN